MKPVLFAIALTLILAGCKSERSPACQAAIDAQSNPSVIWSDLPGPMATQAALDRDQASRRIAEACSR